MMVYLASARYLTSHPNLRFAASLWKRITNHIAVRDHGGESITKCPTSLAFFLPFVEIFEDCLRIAPLDSLHKKPLDTIHIMLVRFPNGSVKRFVSTMELGFFFLVQPVHVPNSIFIVLKETEVVEIVKRGSFLFVNTAHVRKLGDD